MTKFDLSAIHQPVLAFLGTVYGSLAPNTPHQLFQGRPVYPHSIFVDGVGAVPQMDVWPRCYCAGPAKGSRTTRNSKYLLARRTPSAGSRGISFPLDFYLSWTSLAGLFVVCAWFPGLRPGLLDVPPGEIGEWWVSHRLFSTCALFLPRRCSQGLKSQDFC